MTSWNHVETVLCDLDGVIWLAHQPIAGSVDAIGRLRATGRRVLFVTNNSAATQADNERALGGVGIPADGAVISSAIAAAQLVDPGARVLVAGGPGIIEALQRRGATTVLNDGTGEADGFDAVVVGLHRDFDYQRLAVAAAAVRAGAMLIGTNSDPTFPTPTGLLPGGGSILASIAVASDTVPTIAGKPHRAMAATVATLLGTSDRPFDPATVLMVGDRPDTDGLFARELGCHFALVRSGVSQPGELVDVASHLDLHVDLDVDDLAAMVDRIVEYDSAGQ